MSRHSKNSNDRMFFTNKERKDAGFCQSRKEVLGTDAFLPFGYCGLSLKACKNPVATPDGYIYEREFIIESLLNQKMENAEKLKKWEEQERRKLMKEKAAQNKIDNKDVEEFRKAELAITSGDYRHKRALDTSKDAIVGAPENKLRKGELLQVEKSKMVEQCFWIKETTQNAAAAELKKPELATRCPMSGKKLKAKDLMPIKLEVLDQKMLDKGGDRGVFVCAVSKHSITHQQAVCIKPSGIVVLESVLKDCVLKDNVCPITGKKLNGMKDIMKLQSGGTGFSAHNETQAKTNSILRSGAMDNRSMQGHLPAAGYQGLR
eukprot:TRINITY_DN37832_c0_g2_i1.p1 TRINITY_DN37832_c0_g2~~TRINITY_DN37832_c0_g2_i1.p1  ORF type:complete len:319 (+),score=86.25 TRINITY_DN37832_c0_g2_i1:124-1080(+)